VRLVDGFLGGPMTPAAWVEAVVLGVGLPLVLAPLAWWTAPAAARQVTWPLLLLLPLANVVTFTPAPYENTKLLAWFDLAAAPLIAGLLVRVGRRRRALAAALALGCTLSGAQAVLFEVASDPSFLSREDLALADLVARETGPRDVVATCEGTHDPVAILAGRPVLLAAPTIVLSHGLDPRPRARDLAALYAGGPKAEEVIARLGVEAVVVGPTERRLLPKIDEAWLSSRARAVREVAGRRVYLLR
jgi:hypothetical protein